MWRIPIYGVDLSNRDNDQPIDRAKIARAGSLHDKARHVFRSINWGALTCGLAVLLILGAASTPRQVIDNTAVIERLATTLEQMERVKPGTVREVAELLQRPDYDCREVRCDTALEKRNAAARIELERVLAKHSVPATLASTK